MKASGPTTKCTVKERLYGMMAGNMRAIIRTIKNMVLEYSNGPMEENILVVGIMANSMEEANIFRRRGRRRLDNGSTENALNGSKRWAKAPPLNDDVTLIVFRNFL
jgi:hypothetical protein